MNIHARVYLKGHVTILLVLTHAHLLRIGIGFGADLPQDLFALRVS